MIHFIDSPADHAEALRAVAELVRLDPPADSDQGRELLRLADLIEAYERKHFDPP